MACTYCRNTHPYTGILHYLPLEDGCPFNTVDHKHAETKQQLLINVAAKFLISLWANGKIMGILDFYLSLKRKVYACKMSFANKHMYQKYQGVKS